jgi:hypothetical protein
VRDAARHRASRAAAVRPAVSAATWAALAADPTIAADDVALAGHRAAGTDAAARAATPSSCGRRRGRRWAAPICYGGALDAAGWCSTAGGELRVRAGGVEQVWRDARDPRVAPDRRLMRSRSTAGGGLGGAPGRLVATI